MRNDGMARKRPLLLCAAVGLSVALQTSGYSLTTANTFQRQQNWNGLLSYAQSWTRVEPNNANAWAELSVAYFFLNRFDLALDPAKRSVALAPKDPGGYTALGWIYRKLKRQGEAAEAFRHSVELMPKNGNYWNNLASAYSEMGDYRRALQALEQQMQTAGPSQNEVLWFNLANGLSTIAASTRVGASAGRGSDEILHEAVQAYTESLRRNPRYGNAWNNLGVAQEALGATQEALADYQRAASFGDAFGRKNYQALQNAIREAARAAATRSSASRAPSWVTAKEREQWNWDHDLGLQVTRPRPQ
jgi:tetratricopeptide (TPR) repeat protein